MALRGTLGDFGIADIFQLVGHQQKTGILLLKNRELEVRIYFVEGNVVKAEQSSRDKRDLLGNIMVRAAVLTEQQLEEALNQQQRTLRRLGDILVGEGYVQRQVLREFTRLQTTETIYRLFRWSAGTYEFTQQDIEYDEQSYEPIRAENVLMEGFRMVDEWPAIREVIPTDQCTFTVVKEPAGVEQGSADEDEDLLAGLDDAFRELEEGDQGKKKKADAELSANEVSVFGFVAPARTVAEIVDLSRLGEFETTKSLANLVTNGYLDVEIPANQTTSSSARMRITPRAIIDATVPVATRIALYAVVAVAVGGVVKLFELNDSGLLARDRALQVRPGEVQRQVAEIQRRRIERAVEVYRLLEGEYPLALAEVVATGLLDENEVRFPFQDDFSYARAKDGASYRLALPLR
jgi:hypothetical protein